MEENKIRQLLERVARGETPVEKALDRLKDLPYEDLGFAKVDHHRALRRGFPETIYCPGKTLEQIKGIAEGLARETSNILATRANPQVYQALQEIFPRAEYHESARLVIIHREQEPNPVGLILVLSAGTADFPVAEEAALTAEIMGSRVERIYDVGVAGLHRLLDFRKKIQEARVLVVVAGMEGALASVVGGLASCPIIAVPTSVGYGANLAGLTPLLTMLNSCAPGVLVVNIDNGYGAGFSASLINRQGITMKRGGRNENNLL